MAIIQIAAFIIAVLLLAYFFKESFVSVLPGAACGLILLLYVLALIGRLSLIDYLSIGMLAGTGAWLLTKKRRDVLSCWRSLLCEPSCIASIAMVCIVSLCVSAKIATWWDDINFWAADVKSLYYLDGFARKYGNVAPEFGDYPPATQLFKWWFLHLDRDTFREGLAFAGYHALNLIFLFPLLQKKNKENSPKITFMMPLLIAALWLFPGIAEVYGYHGFCADLTMACIYGNFLYAVTDREGHAERFYRLRLFLYLITLVLVKSVGFIWAAFGLVFFFLYQLLIYRQHETTGNSKQDASNRKFIAALTAAPLLSGGSWMAFCLFMRRAAKATTTAVKYITSDEYTWSLYRNEFAKAFVRAFFTEPLHKERSWVFDLTPCTFYLAICALVLLFYKKKLLSKMQGMVVLWFSVISGALIYAIIFVSHLTIFANETQYMEASAMVSSIERYGAPFTVGTLLFLSLLWMEHGDILFSRRHAPLAGYGTVLSFVLLVFLTTSWKDGCDGLIGYRSKTADTLQSREAMTDERSRCFADALRSLGTEHSTRVLYLQSDVPERWVRNSYTNFVVSPVSVIYLHADLNSVTESFMTESIRASHAAYLYADQADAEAEALFHDMTEQDFKLQTLYRIHDDGIQLRLEEVRERHGE